jgi:RimJ/RimL family protein N-acetyltransferase
MTGNKGEAVTRPHFHPPVIENFKGYKSEKQYRIISVDGSFETSENDLKTITEICNEELVYRFLFQDRLKGSAYVINDARKFVIWALDSWEKDESYFFFVRDEDNDIVACLHINSNNLDRTAIGYWVTRNAPGIMTNAVKYLCEIAKKAGYKKLYALVEPVNIKSIGVLQRNGFTYTGTRMEDLLFMDKPVGKQQLFNTYEKLL